jgi:PadR family transcriptional regulator AphA
MPTNRTRYAILGALTVAPMSGYGLRRFFDQSVSFFWRESYGQIYPILKQLRRERLITTRRGSRGEHSSGRSQYVITSRGREALRAWLREAVELQPPRQELLLKLFFAHEGDAASVAGHVRDFRALHEEKLVTYRRVAEEIRRSHARNPNLANWLLTLRFGEHMSRALVAWCDEALESLPRRPARRGG